MIIKSIEKLTAQSFEDFGHISNMINPTGYNRSGPCHKFYRDQMLFPNQNALPTAFSSLQVIKPANQVVTTMEYHNYTTEAMMPLDGDIILCLAPANSDVLKQEEARAFLVPQGTMVVIKTAVWHALPMSVKEPFTNILIVLPERAYHNDLYLKDFEEPFELK